MRLSVRALMPGAAWRWRERSGPVGHARGGGWRGGECAEARGGSASNAGVFLRDSSARVPGSWYCGRALNQGLAVGVDGIGLSA